MMFVYIVIKRLQIVLASTDVLVFTNQYVLCATKTWMNLVKIQKEEWLFNMNLCIKLGMKTDYPNMSIKHKND